MSRILLLIASLTLLPSCGGKATASAPATHADAGDATAVDTSVPDSPIDASDASIEDGPPVTDHIEACPEGVGPSMVLLPEGFCIDSTPVTRAQYAAWLSTNPTLEGQHKRCKQWNTSYEPNGYCEYEEVPIEWQQDHPQACVDWCDAFAYCEAAGKRLCGAIGGGKLKGIAEVTDSTVSQWMAACTSGGANDYPYGDTYDPEACDTLEPGKFDDLAQAGSHPACQSSVPGYEGVYDLSAGLVEWEDNCSDHSVDPAFPNDGSSDACQQRGGLPTTPENARCDAVAGTERSTPGLRMFRCCYP